MADVTPQRNSALEALQVAYDDVCTELETTWGIIAHLVERAGGLETFNMSKLYNDVKDHAFTLQVERNDLEDLMIVRAKRIEDKET